jgi:nitroreductase
MDVLEAIRKRRSVRDFLDREIPPAIVERLEEALIRAPSAGNLQSRRFYFVKDPAVKKRLVRAALGQRFIAQAPLVVVGCADARISRRYGERGVFLYSIQDVSASIMTMMLAATAAGLGTVWVGAFDEEGVSGALDLPDHLRPVAIVPVGYPKRVPSAPPRVTREEAITDL